MPSPAALQIISPEGEVDASDARTRARVPVAHLSSEKIAEALKASSGVMAEAARRLRISRDTLYERARVDPVVEAARTEAREVFLDLGESQLYRLVKEGNPSAVFFLLRTLGARRGWREGVLVEQRPEPPPRHTPEEVTRRLRQLSKDEIEQLERLVLKMEGKTSIHDGIGAVMMSSTTPSAKYSCSGSPLMFVNGSTAMEGLSGSVSDFGSAFGSVAPTSA